MNLGTLENRVKPFATNLNNKLEKYFKKNEKLILSLNRSQLIVEGINIEGKELGSYKPISVTLRSAKGLQTGYIDLSFTGAFQSAMFISYDSNGFTIESQDYKEASLNKRYNQVLGLTNENLTNLVRNQILPLMINEIFR